MIQSLRTAMQPSITHVADSILAGMDPDDLIRLRGREAMAKEKARFENPNPE